MKKRYFLLFLVTLLAGCGVDWFPAVTAPVTLTSIAVTPAAPSIAVGLTQQFTATGTYSDSSTKDLTSTATWTSSTPTFATIATGGLATAIAAGSTTITATSGTITGTTTLTVTAAAVTPVVTRTVSTFAGSSQAQGSQDGTGVGAQFDTPTGITTDGTNLYVADSGANSGIRKIVISSGVVTTIATTDAASSPVTLTAPRGITNDGTNLYVTTGSNTVVKIVILTGVVSTIAPSVTFKTPSGITLVGTNLYVADTGSNTIIKVDTTTGTGSIVAGSSTAGSTDANGTLAKFSGPTGITTDGTNLYVVDQGNSTIRKIVIPTGTNTLATVTTIAGSASANNTGSDDGTGTAALFSSPTGIAIDSNKTNLYVTDTGNATVRQIVIASGAVTTVAGTAGGTVFVNADGITVNGTDLYVTDSGDQTIMRLTPK